MYVKDTENFSLRYKFGALRLLVDAIFVIIGLPGLGGYGAPRGKGKGVIGEYKTRIKEV